MGIEERHFRRIQREINYAEAPGQYNKIFKELSELYQYSANDEQVHQLLLKLKQKAPHLGSQIDSLRGIQDSSGVEREVERIRDYFHRGDFQRVIEEGEALLRQGVQEPRVERWLRDARQAIVEPPTSHQSVAQDIPPEIKYRISRATSMLNAGYYDKVIMICEEASQIALRSNRHVPDKISEIHQQAEYELARESKIQEGLNSIGDGNWVEALKIFEEVFNKFGERDRVYVEKLKTVLQLQNDVDQAWQSLNLDLNKLSSLDAEIQKLLDYEATIKALPSHLGDIANIVKPTTRQETILRELNQEKDALYRHLETSGQNKLQQAKNQAGNQKARLAADAERYLALALKIKKGDDELSHSLNEASKEKIIGQKGADFRRRTSWGTIGLLFFIVSCTLFYFGFTFITDRIEEGEQKSETQQVVDAQNRGTQSNLDTTYAAASATFMSLNQIATATAIANAGNAATAEYERTILALNVEQTQTQIAMIAFANETHTIEAYYARQTMIAQTQAASATAHAIYLTALVPTNTFTPSSTPTITYTPSLTPTPVYRCLGTVDAGEVAVNVREEPSETATKRGSVRDNDVLEIYEFVEPDDSRYGWYEIIHRDPETKLVQISGWVADDFVNAPSCTWP